MNTMNKNFTFRKGFLIGLTASLIMVASIQLVFAFPWLSFLMFTLVVAFLLNAIRTPESR